MNHGYFHSLRSRLAVLLIGCFLPSVKSGFAQTTLTTTPQSDSAQNKTNTNQWKDTDPFVYFETIGSNRRYTPDTALHAFQRRPFLGSWSRDLGNPGSPVFNLCFSPEDRVGPTSGYHVYDAYRFTTASVRYFNTTRPYSEFTYQLGSKLEQVAGLMHTQNIKPNWNFMAQYRKVSAPGFYKVQRNVHDNFCFTTNYKGLGKHYALFAAVVYNKEQHDENGGIVNDSQLTDNAYTDRRTVDVAYQNSGYSINRSTVSNVLRDVAVEMRNSYIWGKSDTIYNKDSTQYTWSLVPRFRLTHRINIGSEKHTYKDLAPDSFRYASIFPAPFPLSSGSYYIAGGDSVYSRQNWNWVDNEISMNGLVGSPERGFNLNAGVGSRYDVFSSGVSSGTTDDRLKIWSNYLTASIATAASDSGKWGFNASGRVYIIGDYTGNFRFKAQLSRAFYGGNLQLLLGAQQSQGSAPYSYTRYVNEYVDVAYGFDKEQQTLINAEVRSRNLKLSAGFSQYVITKYIYIGYDQLFHQYTPSFSLNSIWLKKSFRIGKFHLDNEVVWQRVAEVVPVNIPAVLGRHQFSYDRDAFKNKIKLSTGIDVRYHSAYFAPGYSAVLNRFYAQEYKYVSNFPELSLFFNFRVRHFRAFFMLDQVQQAFARNAILFVGPETVNFYGDGARRTTMYAAQNMMLRFGFNWVLIN